MPRDSEPVYSHSAELLQVGTAVNKLSEIKEGRVHRCWLRLHPQHCQSLFLCMLRAPAPPVLSIHPAHPFFGVPSPPRCVPSPHPGGGPLLQVTHLHIPLLEAACHRERPDLCHPTPVLCLCVEKNSCFCHASPSHSHGRLLASHTVSKSLPQPSVHFCRWLFGSPGLLALVVCSGVSQLKASVTVDPRSRPPPCLLPSLFTVFLSCHAFCFLSSFDSDSISDTRPSGQGPVSLVHGTAPDSQ